MDEPLLSQASSHCPLDPVTGDVLFKQETARRDALRKKGNCLTGCRELDEQVLLGGFERGCVVGSTAEEEEMGLLVGGVPSGLVVGSLLPVTSVAWRLMAERGCIAVSFLEMACGRAWTFGLLS